MTRTDESDTMRVRIPFAGFYCSIHDMTFDGQLEQINEDRERIGMDNVDWRMVHFDYAKAYTGKLDAEMPFSMRFQALDSPRFYNFATDAIFAEIPREDLESHFSLRMADPDWSAAFDAHVAEKLAPRAGFAPYYDNDYREWGPVTEWDEAQMSVIVDFVFQRRELDEYAIAEDLSDTAHDLIWRHVRDPSVVPGHVDGPDEDSPEP